MDFGCGKPNGIVTVKIWPNLNGPLKCYGPIIWDILYRPWLFKCLKGYYIFYYAKVASKNFESYLRNEMILTGNPIIELCSNLLKKFFP